MTLSDGTRVGPYQVLSLVGVGGMGEVYRARDTTLNRDIALKVLPGAGDDGLYVRVAAWRHMGDQRHH